MQIQSTNQIPMTQPQKAIYTENKADDILSGQHDIYRGDIDISEIYKNLSNTTITTTTREGEIVQITLAEMRFNNAQGGKGKYTGDIFPSNWTENQIHQWYMNRNNTKGHWLPHGDKQPKTRNRKKYVISPEVSPE